MSGGGDTTEARKHPASRRKLRRLRRDGMVAKSVDLSSMLSGIAGGAAFLLLLPISLTALLMLTDTVFDQIDEPFELGAPVAVMALRESLLRVILPVAGAAAAVALVTSLAFHEGLVVSFKPLIPKIERVSPWASLKSMFGMRGLVEHAMATLRLTLWAILAWVVLGGILEEVLHAGICGAVCTYEILIGVFWPIMISAAVLFLIFAFLDALLQKKLFLHEQRMTDSEQKRESKEQYGSPEVRRERKRLQRQLTERAEHIGIDKANMLVFFEDRAVALRYHKVLCPAPRVSAKGVGEAAVQRMRERVAENGFPEWSSEELVEKVIATEVGDFVPSPAFPSLVAGMQRAFGGRRGQ